MYSGPAVPDEQILAVCVIVNGPLGISAGKIASQSFQAALTLRETMHVTDEHAELYRAWREQGSRTVVRVAQTEAVFARVLSELDGVSLQDEGLTEVDRGAVTVFCTFPYLRGAQPKLLSHKKLPLLRG